jgi:FKBP-type peptidyl-prolyl cis-trans isomerase FkpA
MQNGKLIGFIALGVLVVVTVGLAIVLNRPQAKSNSQAAATSNQQTNTQGGSMQLEKTDEVVGTGAEATVGKTVSVNYVGTLTNGTKFDSSYDRNQPFEFKLGSGQVIQGWDEGVAGMKVGGKRKLVIPPDLGYGAQGAGSTIPPNSTLVFEIELLDVK